MSRTTAATGFFLAFMIAILTLQLGTALAAKNKDAVAVIIGNKDYTSSIPTVEFAHRDADAFKVFATDVLGYLPDNIIDLRDATKAQLESAFGNRVTHEGKLWRYLDPKGKSDVMVFYSGHGVPGLRDRKGYLLPVNADPDTPEINGYPLDTLFANLAKLEARSVSVFLDACFSGDSQKGMLVNATSGIVIKPRMPGQTASRMNIITAAQGDQVASWDLKARHGIFTKHLLEALYGGADGDDYGNGDGKVVLSEVKAYLDDRMTRAARRQFGRHQNAWVKGGDDTVLVAAIPKTPSPTLMTAEEKQQRQARIKLAQQALRDLGLYRGGMDGVLGPMTQAALAGWLAGNGYAKDAELDDGLVGKLGQAAQRHLRAAREAEARRQAQEQARLAKLEMERQRQAEEERKAAEARKAKAAARLKPGETFKDCDDCPEMVVIPRGTFKMGSPPAEREWFIKQGAKQEWADYEIPRHSVNISHEVAVGKFEVTRGQYGKFAADTGRGGGDGCYTWADGKWTKEASRNWRSPGFEQTDSHPVACVSWDDAKAYVDWLSKETGEPYRLLSEAEWEYVARAGTSSMRYWGHDWDNKDGCAFANVTNKEDNWTRAFNCSDGHKYTAPIGKYRPNAFGLHDMLGNLWEWTEDCWNTSYTGSPADGSAWTNGDCNYRVLRVGSWSSVPWSLRAAGRDRFGIGIRSFNYGFRVARTLSR